MSRRIAFGPAGEDLWLRLVAQHRITTRRSIAVVTSWADEVLAETYERFQRSGAAITKIPAVTGIPRAVREHGAEHQAHEFAAIAWVDLGRGTDHEALIVILRELNVARETLADGGPVLIVLAGEPGLERSLAENAPDLNSVLDDVIPLPDHVEVIDDGSRSIRFLQLSDLHVGCRAQDEWWSMLEVFRSDLKEQVRKRGTPDLVLVTGDLAFKGDEAEYAQLPRFFDRLRDDLGAEPMILPVPGNHDLARPSGTKRYGYKVLDQYAIDPDATNAADLDLELFERGDEDFLRPLFADYLAWFEEYIVPQLGDDSHVARIPGDFSVIVEPAGAFPLLVVGLNSSWQQYDDTNYYGRLRIPPQQFHAALADPDASGASDSPLGRFRRTRQAILLQHHPSIWLSPRAQHEFETKIYPPGRFALCLYGHMHEAQSMTAAISGGRARYFYQSPSLLGIEHYGTGKATRAIGYTWGEIDSDGISKLWPRAFVDQDGGRFVPDQRFVAAAEGVELGATMKTLAGAGRGAGTGADVEDAGPPADLPRYLDAVIADYGHISIAGIGSGLGRGRSANRVPIEDLFTELRTRRPMPRETQETAQALLAGLERSEVALVEVLWESDRLLLEGQPGAGKSTFLFFVATMLAHDLRGTPCPKGRSWRESYLGDSSEHQPEIPILIRASIFATLLATGPATPPTRERLLDAIEQQAVDNKLEIPRPFWKDALENGTAVLFFDGLDEVTDAKTRDMIFTILADAARHWTKARIVVASRPIDTGRIEAMGFVRTTVEPFDRECIGAFLNRWVGVFMQAPNPDALTARGRDYSRALHAAIMQRHSILRLAQNPVMLTCLCVVHWNEGELPEGRPRVYRAVVRWLIDARTRLRIEQNFDDRTAELAFQRLALALMTFRTAGETNDAVEAYKVSSLPLEQCAVAVVPSFERVMPNAAHEDILAEARRWLAFECTGSGIIEEIGSGQLRFWHLTFQEYLAAAQLAQRPDAAEHDGDKVAWWPVVREHLEDAQWRETIDMFPGCLYGDTNESRVDVLLGYLRGQLPGDSLGDVDLAVAARTFALLVRALATAQACGYRPDAETIEMRDRLRDRVLEVFEAPTGEAADAPVAAALPAEERIAVADALGRAGDPRIDAAVDPFLEVAGAGFSLGRFPVTVEEFARFLADGRGYETEDWWLEDWSVRVEQKWTEPDDWVAQLAHPNRPVVGVSWYEAQAYCRWFAYLGDRHVHLPTSEQWEQAATASQGEFPWGDEEVTDELANYGGNVGHPTPVGVYPRGAGPHGHLDLAGNVWEWCADGDGDDEGAKWLRGGAWRHPALSLHFAFRGWGDPDYRFGSIGFRVALSPASSGLGS